MIPRIREKKAYSVRSLIEHLVEERSYERLFELLEEKDFLARQAGVLGGFRQGSLDLETHVLPVAVGQRDWPRFLRHAVVAAGLRDLAEALADEDVVGALVGHGQDALARDIVEQLSDPQRRIRTLAVVLGSRPRGSARPIVDERAARLVDELDRVPSPAGADAARTWLVTLRAVARHLGPELRGHWSGWIGRLGGAPELADDAWLAVAESWLERDLESASGLWPALAEVTSKERILEFLPRALAASPRRTATFLDNPLPPPFEEQEELLLHVRVALLAAGTGEDPWPRLRDEAVRSVELVELGRALWPRLRPAEREDLAAGIAEATVRAAFRVVVLEELRKATGKETFLAEEAPALAALDGLPPRDQLHWTLRCLAALAPSRRRQHVRSVAHHLYTVRYDVSDAADLARFVDLVAEDLSKELPRLLPNAFVVVPSSDAEKLRTLALRCQRPEVLEELWKNVERYVAAVSKNESEGFQLRAEVLSRVTGRLCALRRELQPYEEALERLLPEEEDPLRLAVIHELAAIDETSLALKVCAELRSRRLALRTRLRLSIGGEGLDELLEPAALYEAVSGSDAVGDELAALTPLLESPAKAESPGGRGGLFLDVGDSDRRILALLDLARHDLAYQQRAYRPGQRDLVAVLQPLSRVVGGVTTDRRLVALTPELVELGCRVSPGRAVAELQEAVLRLLRLQEVSWPLRAEALETLLGHAEGWVLAEEDARLQSRRQALVTFFRWMARVPSLPELPDEDLHDRWPELLPIVLASAERLPEARRSALRRHPLFPIDGWLPRAGVVKRLRSPWDRGAEGFASWAADAPEVLTACFASSEELARYLKETVDPQQPSPTAGALLCLLAVRDAGQARELLKLLAPAAREALELRLVRHGWMDGEILLGKKPTSPRLRLARGLPRDAEAVADGVAEALAGAELDPLDARAAPVRRALWTVATDDGRARLARAVVRALAVAGRSGGERALCFWVHSWVQPRPGEEAPVSRERRDALVAALRRAESIPGPS